jgi:hypothetical protein
MHQHTSNQTSLQKEEPINNVRFHLFVVTGLVLFGKFFVWSFVCSRRGLPSVTEAFVHFGKRGVASQFLFDRLTFVCLKELKKSGWWERMSVGECVSWFYRSPPSFADYRYRSVHAHTVSRRDEEEEGALRVSNTRKLPGMKKKRARCV